MIESSVWMELENRIFATFRDHRITKIFKTILETDPGRKQIQTSYRELGKMLQVDGKTAKRLVSIASVALDSTAPHLETECGTMRSGRHYFIIKANNIAPHTAEQCGVCAECLKTLALVGPKYFMDKLAIPLETSKQLTAELAFHLTHHDILSYPEGIANGVGRSPTATTAKAATEQSNIIPFLGLQEPAGHKSTIEAASENERDCIPDTMEGTSKGRGNQDPLFKDETDQSDLTPKPPKKSRPKKPKAASKDPIPGTQVWEIYKTAYLTRYKTEPLRNAKVNTQINNIIKQVGLDEAKVIVEYYVSRSDFWYTRNAHDIGICLQHLQRLNTERVTGTLINSQNCKSAELAEHNHHAAEDYLKWKQKQVSDERIRF